MRVLCSSLRRAHTHARTHDRTTEYTIVWCMSNDVKKKLQSNVQAYGLCDATISFFIFLRLVRSCLLGMSGVAQSRCRYVYASTDDHISVVQTVASAGLDVVLLFIVDQYHQFESIARIDWYNSQHTGRVICRVYFEIEYRAIYIFAA